MMRTPRVYRPGVALPQAAYDNPCSTVENRASACSSGLPEGQDDGFRLYSGHA